VSPAGDEVSPEGDLLASPNFGICDTTQFYQKYDVNIHSFVIRQNKYFICMNTEYYTIKNDKKILGYKAQWSIDCCQWIYDHSSSSSMSYVHSKEHINELFTKSF
jgi:hypothetical protein